MKKLRRILFVSAMLLLCTIPLIQAQQTIPPVDQKKACLECHGDMEPLLKAPHPHGPVASGQCSECHNPHASSHAALLNDDEKTLCAKCHTQGAAWEKQSNVHTPVAQGHCIRCHEPHGSNNANLLAAPTTELCATCHTSVRDWVKKSVVHDPVKKGRCGLCHDPHASGQDNLLIKEQSTLCLSCHTVTAEFSAKHRGFDPAQATCSACHDPHAGDAAGLIMKNKHLPFAQGRCNECHVATNAGLPLRGTENEVCSKCHEQQVTAVTTYKSHGATAEHSCDLCHKPHASHESGLLAQSPAQLCTKCHDPAKGAKPQGENPHAKFVCVTCHEPHGSENVGYLYKPDLQLCANCHSREHHVSHPMGEDIIEPLSGKPVTCLSCHDLHAWKAEPLLPAGATRDLCIRCHRDKVK